MKQIILSVIFCLAVFVFAIPTHAGPFDVPDNSYTSQTHIGP